MICFVRGRKPRYNNCRWLHSAEPGGARFVGKGRGRFPMGRQVSIGNSPSTVGESSSQVLDGRERESREDGVDLYNPRQVQVDRAGLLRDRLRRDVDEQKSGRQANSNQKRSKRQRRSRSFAEIRSPKCRQTLSR